ncbi:Ca2+-binding protein 1 [Striga hermonthica]|uniref:Ca2+-binding protein 1 n=1 Tax=Striga hermonthica TaxID=68872 RepID=A0A9N7MCJ6_STRHE|nr:Ca2+-binding protein 1 [Striga hermonthica]
MVTQLLQASSQATRQRETIVYESLVFEQHRSFRWCMTVGRAVATMGCNMQKEGPESDEGMMEATFRVMNMDGDRKVDHKDLKSYFNWGGFDATTKMFRPRSN